MNSAKLKVAKLIYRNMLHFYTLCSWVGRIKIVKRTIYPRQSIDSIQSLSKYQWHFSQK